ncbi:monothiol glutaredoxin-S12, chloroplastic isoform X2 [Iris pallida]|uniref:Monothiol glutaredoxin-S12, chloroplastic isoform X2 n=1 Tax=Iris pallida TaxID=29817 RepID=A0AAX6HRB8_IRIPA|nr:monothiol glutaredoxin-S12, chloroplastic isoform X2 [Iris pallida]
MALRDGDIPMKNCLALIKSLASAPNRFVAKYMEVVKIVEELCNDLHICFLFFIVAVVEYQEASSLTLCFGIS